MKDLEENISPFQLALLIILFEIGSAIIVGIGNDAKQDAWIAIIIATVIGLLLVTMFTYVSSFSPGRNLFQIMEYSFGRVITIMICFCYILYFLYIAARVLRDFGEILVTVTYQDTPIEFILLVFMVTVAYVIYLGLEVIGRVSELLFPYVIFFLVLIILFFVIQGSIQLENVKPVLAEGLTPVIKSVFPELVGFPFGELIVFTLIWSNTSRFKLVGKVSLIATSISGGILIITSLVKITVLGPNMINRSPFPLLSAVRNISLANFIERIDALVIFMFMVGILIKIILFVYASLKGLEYISQIPYRPFVFPICMLISFFSVIVTSNFAEHIEEGIQIVPLYLHMPFQVVIPLFLLVTLVLKKKMKGGVPPHEI